MFLWFSCAKQSSIQLEPSNSNLALSWKSNSVPVLLDESCNLPLLFKPSMVQRLLFSAKPSYRLEIPLGYYKKKSCPDHLLQLAFTTLPIYCCVWALSKAKKKKMLQKMKTSMGLAGQADLTNSENIFFTNLSILATPMQQKPALKEDIKYFLQ